MKRRVAKIRYRAAEGSRLSDKDAEIIAIYLNTLYPTGATPEEVLQAAKRVDAPPELRNKFTWDNKHAAEQYRIGEARRILRAIQVVIVSEGREVKTRAYNSIVPHGSDHKVYVPMQIVFSTPDYANQVVEDARRELESWRAKYELYKQLAGAVRVVRTALSKIP